MLLNIPKFNSTFPRMNLKHLLILFLPLLLLLQIHGAFADDHERRSLGKWCSDVPHPESCTKSLPRHEMVDRPTFYGLSLEASLTNAIAARNHLRGFKKNLAKSDYQAWYGCENLYTNTVLQLNRTILFRKAIDSPYDYQTWLSAALTNLDVCGSRIFTSDVMLPDVKFFNGSLTKYNVSQLISNCLAINEPNLITANQPTALLREKEYRGRILATVKPDIIVAKDGSGKYSTIGPAVRAGARRARVDGRRLVIYVKKGVYNENINIPSSMRDVTLIGDGKGKTIITGRNSVKDGYTLITSATLAVFGDGFVAMDLTIRNTYGLGSQALALLLASDNSVIYRASLEGYQDTLCVFSQRQFYRECDIYGTVDFIFGNAAAVIQKCNIIARKPAKGGANVITAQGRTDPNQNTGIVIQFCNIISSPEFWPVHRTVSTYLGRPWKIYSRTVFLQNYFSSIVHLKGYLEFRGTLGLDTLYYAEFRNTGPSSLGRFRVKWPGYHVIVRPSLVKQFTVNSFIAGGVWITTTGVPFTGGF
ncbi:pectin methylesterase, family CE8 [Zostera marina]|uniref:Pectinesterase n=1 Tax=Zostera marina TaxID=29655 RepID=A0A0K9Q0W3_ZOSMR|nr:pectin methylesterase, family CE8 [Zostera marina]